MSSMEADLLAVVHFWLVNDCLRMSDNSYEQLLLNTSGVAFISLLETARDLIFVRYSVVTLSAKEGSQHVS